MMTKLLLIPTLTALYFIPEFNERIILVFILFTVLLIRDDQPLHK